MNTKKWFLFVLTLLCVFLFSSCSPSRNSDEHNLETESKPIPESSITSEDETSEENILDEGSETTVEDIILSFVNSFNSDSQLLEYVEDFMPSDKTSSHYRVEFRLSAYNEAVGKSYLYKDALVDIIARKSFSKEDVIRIYMSSATLEQCIEMIKISSPLMDATITDDDIQKVIDYITERKEANGYIYGDLAIVLLGNDVKGYELMIKMKND